VAILLLTTIYNNFNILNLKKIFYDNTKIFSLNIWTSSSQSELLPVSPEIEKEILNLLKSPIYYKESTTSFRGDVEAIRMTIVSSNNNSEVYYDYEISNTGKILIRNKDTEKGGFYLLGRHLLFYDYKNSSEKELYNQLVQLISTIN
jgi:hypothetical protein